MKKNTKRIAVTGAAGQIAYNLLFRIASGEMFGPEQPIELHLIEVEQALPALRGVCMELEDCAYPLLRKLRIGSDPFELFGDIDLALLIGAKPRSKGMERSDLLAENAKLFVTQGKALDASAKSDVKVVVVGNPCNTNCLIALQHAPRLSPYNFSAMTRLDQNRACAFLAAKADKSVSAISNVVIWGNHSSTQVPDPYNATVDGVAAAALFDESWLQVEFVKAVQERGAQVIQARGKSSAASAANAILDHIHALYTPTPEGRFFSMAVFSAGNDYRIDEELVFSFPCRSNGGGSWQLLPNLPWHPFVAEEIALTESELQQERHSVYTMSYA